MVPYIAIRQSKGWRSDSDEHGKSSTRYGAFDTQQISKPQQNPCSAKRSAVYNAKWQLHLNWLSI